MNSWIVEDLNEEHIVWLETYCGTLVIVRNFMFWTASNLFQLVMDINEPHAGPM